MIREAVLQTDPWIEKTIDTYIRQLTRMLNNPKLRLNISEVVLLARHDHVLVKYPTVDGQEEVKYYYKNED